MSETREQLVMDTFVELADTLASDYDIGDFLHMLVERCGAVLKVDTGGVVVEAPEGGLQLVAATSEEMRKLEQLELETGEGPCLDAYRHVEQVLAADLREEQERWPRTAPRAVDIGLVAVYAFPLRLRGDCIGALNLYRKSTGEFRGDDVRLAQAFADVAAIGILQERKITEAHRRSEQLQGALESRIVIEQAKGVLAERHGIGLQEAFESIRRYSRTRRRKLSEVCAEILAGGAASDLPVGSSPAR